MTFHRPLDTAAPPFGPALAHPAAGREERLPWPRAALVLGLVSLGLWIAVIGALRGLLG